MKIKKLKTKILFFLLIFISVTLSTGYILYSISLLKGIENIMRLLLAVTLVMIWLCIIVSSANSKKKRKIKITFWAVLIYSIGLCYGGYYINKMYSSLAGMTTSSTSYSTSIVTLESNKVDDIKKIKDGKIGILSDSTSIVGNTLPLEIIKSEKLKNETLEYDNFPNMIEALLNKEITYAFLPTNYLIMFNNMEGADFDNLDTKTKIIYTKTKEVEGKENNNKKLDKPFTILLMGVDSELENLANASFNGDSLMLITFNPTTLSSTILSIPRDSYVPIACFPNERKNKITHAAWYGEQCMIETIQNFTDIHIDYYVKINFKGVVKLVDTLGGVEMDIPYSFCESNSNREFGKGTIYVDAGLQVLDGEKALAFARNRHSWPQYCGAKYSNYYSNDFIRGQHQQEVVRALMNKLSEVKSLNKVSDVLDTISNSMETNMSTSEILSLYNIGKDILAKASGGNFDDLVSMQRLYLNGHDATIYDPAMRLNLYNYVLYENSIKAVSEAMKINLGLLEPELEKEFSFSIDNEYEENVIGKNVTGGSSVKKLPDFTGDSEAQARSTCNSLGISCSFKTVTTGNGTNNTVIAQSLNAGYDVSYVNSLTLTLLKKAETKEVKNEEPKKEIPKVEVTEEPEDEDLPDVLLPTDNSNDDSDNDNQTEDDE